MGEGWKRGKFAARWRRGSCVRAVVRADRGIVAFKTVGPNHAVPMQPWPQSFYVSRTMVMTDAVEVRPLTVTGLLKGVGRNFVSMNWWRLCWMLRGLGFLKTPEACCYRWSDLTLAVWRYQQIRRFRWVRATIRAYARGVAALSQAFEAVKTFVSGVSR